MTPIEEYIVTEATRDELGWFTFEDKDTHAWHAKAQALRRLADWCELISGRLNVLDHTRKE